ncbi:MAG: bifunctional phosphoribosylaminoimidazolecarboxamide formyltransferase/IMP cyclohydrolase [Bacteroidales bacterium]|nr:bifunctional phosphoribosylaminoimidazolecarboxamide formyltransferase/IMP cyclohydrolase [Bacteroidales bacterium]
MEQREIKRALISVYHKDGIDKIAKRLVELGAELLSTGGTYDYIQSLGLPVRAVEEVTGYPSILGGRVKTLHPKVFGGILHRRELNSDTEQIEEYQIPAIDLVIVDLYPFEKYVASNSPHEEIVEKIDIGGISLIRAAAKNYKDVLIVPSMNHYPALQDILSKGASTTIEERRKFAAYAFETSSGYDTAIFSYFNREEGIESFRESRSGSKRLRYGENPHQGALFYGEEDSLPEQIWGKEISYNNLLDIEAAIELIGDFERTTVAVLKHNNACGCASRESVSEAWDAALACDPVSAFGGIIISNREIDRAAAEGMNKIFFEVVIAPSYTDDALTILKEKKNRIILINRRDLRSSDKFRSLLGGVLVQDRDTAVEEASEHKVATHTAPDNKQMSDLTFANKLVKHSKSNAIVLAKGETLLASGIGQTSRVDALKQAITKAESFGFSLEGAVMASDAFFPFPDCVEIADNAGIKAVIQPGGSVRDQESTDYCNNHNISMVFTGVRHFKH